MAPPILALKDVRLADGPRPLFEGVELALEARARACLVGRNGAGKSTLLRLMAGLIEADSGERVVTGGARMAFVAQEPPMTGITLLDYATAGGALAHEAEQELEAFDLDPRRSTEGLSGGETRRAALARALAEQPDVLLLDEPTNHLDILAIQTLERRLAASRAAVLTVSHDRAFLNRITRQCFWLEGRRIRQLDKGFAAFALWAEAQAAEDAEQLRRLTKAIERETYTFYRSITAQRTRNEGRARNLEAMRQARALALKDQSRPMELALDAGAVSGKRVVEARGLSKAFGDRVLLKSFSTRILRGDRVAIVGPNGAGKSTLVKLLLGELAPDEGSVKLGTGLEIAYVDQSRARLNETATLWDTLAPFGGDQIVVRGQAKHIAAYAKEFLFRDSQLRQPVASLSGGERNRLLLSIALAKPANLLVLDEPTNDLDMDTLDLLEDVLASYEGTLLLVSHDRDFIDRLATSTIALIGQGRVLETPGGWTDFIQQNPEAFVAAPLAQSIGRTAAPRAIDRPKLAATAKLSYKDQRRLEMLTGLIDGLPAVIAEHERALDDPALYGRDRAKFDRLSTALTKARAELAAAEDEWLELESLKEQRSLS